MSEQKNGTKIQSLRTRLISIQILVAVGVLVLCTLAFILNDIRIFKQTTSESLQSEAQLLSMNIESALQFVDKTEVAKILSFLKSDSDILSAAVFDAQGNLFGQYGESVTAVIPPSFHEHVKIMKMNEDDITLFFPIWKEKDFLGTLYLKQSLNHLWKLYRQGVYLATLVLVFGLLISYFMATLMQRILSRPIVNLAQAAKRVSVDRDYSIRIEEDFKNPTEEIVILFRQFNLMLEQIQIRDHQIQSTNEVLERRVQERTKELEETQKLALENAHTAGMAEIATGILHNIGNIVNSVNTSAEEIHSTTYKSNIAGLNRANELLQANFEQIGTFITSDPRGKELPRYYLKVGEALKSEQTKVLTELAAMTKNILLIKDVIQSQQDYAKKRLFFEEIYLNDLMDDIIEMQGATFRRHRIQIVKKYSATPLIRAQRGKLANVLLNLMKNAKESMEATEASRRTLTIEIGQEPEGQVVLKLTDVGTGISKNDLNKIFNHGFSTKKQGHGFGLHFCANAMTEMGGKLIVESEGVGKGATFVLRLPLAMEREG